MPELLEKKGVSMKKGELSTKFLQKYKMNAKGRSFNVNSFSFLGISDPFQAKSKTSSDIP